MDAKRRKEALDHGFDVFMTSTTSDRSMPGYKAVFGAGVVVALAIMKGTLDEIKENPDLKTRKDVLDEMDWEILEFANEYTHHLDKGDKEGE